MSLPPIERYWALFLDLDGTLLDIAPSPDRVVVPCDLVETLERVRDKLDGAVAIVSGRKLSDIDQLLSPAKFAGASEHGAILRLGSGVLERAPLSQRPPQPWLAALRERTQDWPGVLVEEKDYAITVHYRSSPQYESEVKALVTSFVHDVSSDFKIVSSKKAFEIRPKGITKGLAVKSLMKSEPFRGRTPVFVGDDVTDEDGIRMAAQLGGFGLRVASAFGGKASAVRAWIRRGADRME